jgi:cytidylate kinase
MEEARADVTERDERDSARAVAPLRRAPDAMYIDTTLYPLDEVVAMILKEIGG